MNPLSPSSVWAQMMKTSSYGGVGDPVLTSVQYPHLAFLVVPGPGLHVSRVRAVVWFRETKAADNFPGCQPGQILLSLLLTAKVVDGIHHQAGLDRHGRPVAGVHPLHLPGDETVGDVGHPGTAVALDGRAQHPELPHLAHDVPVEDLVPVGHDDPGHEFVLTVLVEDIPHHHLLLRQATLQVESVAVVELHLLTTGTGQAGLG